MTDRTFKETETPELKKSTSELKEAIISIAAILNKHRKGEIYFGIKNDGSVVGQDIGEQTIQDVSKAASGHSVLCAAAAATFFVVFHECRTHSGKPLCSRNHSRMNRMVFGSAGYPLPKSPTSARSVPTA